MSFLGKRKTYHSRGTRQRMQKAKMSIPRSIPQSVVNKQVAKAIQKAGESKYVDFPFVGVVLDDPNLATNGNIFCINPMQAGAGFFNRIGRKTKTLSIRVKLQFTHKTTDETANSTLGQSSNMIRYALIYDRENTGVVPTFNAMFAVTDNQGSLATTLSVPLKLQVADRFRVIADEVLVINPIKTPLYVTAATQTQTNYEIHTLDRFYDVSKREFIQSYQSTTNPASIADLSSGAIYLVLKPLIYNSTYNQISINQGSVRTKVSDM